MGLFTAYIVGNIASAQLAESMEASGVSIAAAAADRDYGEVLGWTRTNVHSFGRSLTMTEILERATGRPLDAEPYRRHLTGRYEQHRDSNHSTAKTHISRFLRRTMSINALFEPTVLDWDRAAPFVSSPAQVLDVAAGTKTSWPVSVTRRASGRGARPARHVAKGKTDGPVLALVAAVHGDAIYGSRIVMEAFKRINTDELAGTVIAVPVANPIAFESHTRATGQGMNTDMNNMNRVFPGNLGGWVTQKMAATLATYVWTTPTRSSTTTAVATPRSTTPWSAVTPRMPRSASATSPC